MADEFQTGICGGNWWNSSRNASGSLPCSTALNDIGSFGWPTDMADMKARSTCEESASVSDSSIVFQNIQKPQQPDTASGEGSVLMDSTLQMMGFGLSSLATSDWNQTLLRGSGKVESNYDSMLQDDMSSRLNYRQERGMEAPQIQKNWSPTDFAGGGEDSSINAFKPINQSLNSGNSATITCQGLPTSFPMGSASYGYPSTLLQSLFEPDPQPQQSLFDNQSMNYQSTANYRTNSSEFMPSWHKFSPFLKPSLPKQQPSSHLHFSNNTPFWNASAAAVNDIRTSFLPPSQSQFLSPTFEEKPNCANLTAKPNIEEVQDSGSAVKKSSSDPPFKRPRIETPSPLPTFKVRKEKLGDRITALQQLVAPFGKTDTASVLHEAIEYIKFLHDQVSVLSTPYLKNGASIQHQQSYDKLKDPEGPKQDLRSRGLCLVPVSSTFPVANETTADFWAPTFRGGTFR